ncbi:hypothetical protein [Methylobacterium oryzisoli]|uniref:hypothetical protein n=1 Tax=Methylobacterium oryzisoli TaxID=3385502 RepID=UPI0038915EAB
MLFLAAAAIGGGTATAVLAASHGYLVALLAAPFGGSVAALGAGLSLASMRGHDERDRRRFEHPHSVQSAC